MISQIMSQKTGSTSHKGRKPQEIPSVGYSKLAIEVSQVTGLTYKDSMRTVRAIFQAMQEALRREERIKITGFGSFRTKLVVGGVVNADISLKYFGPIHLMPRKKVKFKPSPILKKMLKDYDN
jgi:nucleoid DNA-binding protein